MPGTRFEPVSIEENKPAKAPNNNRVVVIGLAAILLVVVIVVVVIVLYVTLGASAEACYNVNRGGSCVGLPGALDGGWTVWKPWSQCSASCGGGTQRRQRACADPEPLDGGKACVGRTEETRSCSDWPCPECSKECPPGGHLENCTLCICADSTARGGVTRSGSQLPVSGVRVYEVSQQWKPLSTTDAHGVFSIKNICAGETTKLKFSKDGYLAERESYEFSGQPIQVIMAQVTKPVFRQHPQSTAALIGDTITLTCRASGVPDHSKYEWFKDGYILDNECLGEQCRDLHIKDAQLDHSGSYKCRAVSPAGKRFSNPAVVVVEGSAERFCQEDPEPRMITLPATCQATVDGSLVKSIDLGRCTSSPCAVKNSADSERPCCGAVGFQHIEVTCKGFSYSLKRTTSCGCSTCTTEQTTEVSVEGRVLLAARDPSKPGSFISGPLPPYYNVAYSYLHASFGDFTDYIQNGEFEIHVAPVRGRVVIRFPAGEYTDYLPQVSVIDIPEGVTKVYQKVILMPKKEVHSVDVQPDVVTSVQYGDGGREPAGTLTIPAKSVAPVAGGLATRAEPFSMIFADPREPSSLSMAPGSFTFEDEEGEVRELQTFGVLGISGDRYFISGEVEMEVDPEVLGIATSEDGEPDAWLWAFDEQSGDWTKASRLSYGQDGGRKKRQTQLARARAEIPYPLSYLNIDKPLLRGRECKVAVVVYDDTDFSIALEGQSVTVYTKDKDSGVYIGVSSGTTDKRGRSCISIPCGYTHELKVASLFGTGTASPTHDLPSEFDFQNLAGSGGSGSDVIYDSVAFNSPDPETSFSNGGPVYRFKSYGSACPTSMPFQHHFKFRVPPMQVAGSLNAVELRPHRKLSWYQLHADEPRQACMVRLRIQTLDEQQTQVLGVSRFGDKNGDAYGTYTAGMTRVFEAEMGRFLSNEYSACVQVKCPQEIRDTDDMTEYGFTSTYVSLHIAHPNASSCKLRWVQRLELDDDRGWGSEEEEVPVTPAFTIDQVTNSSISMSIDSTGGRVFGGWHIFTAEGPGDGGYRRALHSCVSSYGNDLALFDCAEGKVDMGWWNSPESGNPQM